MGNLNDRCINLFLHGSLIDLVLGVILFSCSFSLGLAIFMNLGGRVTRGSGVGRSFRSLGIVCLAIVVMKYGSNSSNSRHFIICSLFVSICDLFLQSTFFQGKDKMKLIHHKPLKLPFFVILDLQVFRLYFERHDGFEVLGHPC